MKIKYKQSKAIAVVSAVVFVLGLVMMNDALSMGGLVGLLIASFVYYKEKKKLESK